MDFNPPLIKTIDDVLPHIKDKPEILVMTKDKYTVIDYVYQNDKTFDNPYARECRGLKFDLEGQIIARPYHKFKNLNEDEEYQVKNVDFTKNHLMLDKLDGSMVHSVFVDGDVELHTRKGMSEVAKKASALLFDKYLNILNMIHHYYDCTLIFEYIGPQNKIVLDYDVEELVLTGMRKTFSGAYIPYGLMRSYAEKFNVNVVEVAAHAIEDNGRDRDTTIGLIKEYKASEGVVVRFDSGAMIKIKADIYVLRHRSKDMVSNFCDLVKMLLDGTIDDIRPLLDDKTLEKISVYSDDFYRQLNFISKAYKRKWLACGYDLMSKKSMALSLEVRKVETTDRFVLFKLKDAQIKHPDKVLNDREVIDTSINLFSERLKAAAGSKVKLTEFCQEHDIPIYEGSFFDT